MTNHPNRSRQRSQRIAAEAERWAPILRGLSPYEAAERIIENLERAPIGERGKETVAGALLATARLAQDDPATDYLVAVARELADGKPELIQLRSAVAAYDHPRRNATISPYGEQG